MPEFTDGIVEEENEEEDLEEEEGPPETVGQEENVADAQDESQADAGEMNGLGDEDPLIFDERGGPCFLSVKRALQFME